MRKLFLKDGKVWTVSDTPPAGWTPPARKK
jgi:hypothetical protein